MSRSPLGPARRRTFTPYVMLYLLAAGLAAAYLVFLGVRPDLVAMWRAKPDDTKLALAETKGKVDRVLSEIDPLKQGVGAVQAEVASLKSEIQDAADRDRLLLTKVETLERAATQTSDKVSATPAAAKKQAVAKAAAPAAARATAAPAAKPAAPAIETGSIETKKAAAPAKPAAVGVLLATGPSVDSLRLRWTMLNDRHSDAVRALHARYVVSGKDNQRTFGLVAGPLETVADARAMCKTMVDRGEQCEVSQFRGNAF